MSASVAREGGGVREAVPATRHQFIDFDIHGGLTLGDMETICSIAMAKGAPPTAHVVTVTGGALVQWDTPIETGGTDDRPQR